MPRFMNIDTISFTDANKDTWAIKDLREIPSEPVAYTMKLVGDEYVDEIASRDNVYGEDGEELAYQIIDANSVNLLENNFDLNKLAELKIPS